MNIIVISDLDDFENEIKNYVYTYIITIDCNRI